MSWRLISFFRFSGDVRMPGERTLLNNFVGEPDAPTKSAKAYLSNSVFHLLYAKANLPLMTRICFGTVFFPTAVLGKCSEADSKTANRFWSFLQLFLCSVAIGFDGRRVE
tara:strand:- start:622 stop:951 length:330 start_codon:yes stop_codon:yes gene_type:complete